MARQDQMNYARTKIENDKPPMPSTKGLVYVEVPELTQEGGIPTRIYARTKDEAREKARQAIKTSGVAQITNSVSLKDQDRKAYAKAGKVRHDPRLAIGKRFGEWVVFDDPKIVVNSSGVRAKAVPVECSCGFKDIRPPSSLFRGVSTMCPPCSRVKNRERRQEEARSKAA